MPQTIIEPQKDDIPFTWDDVKNSQEYKSFDASTQIKVKLDYFDTIVKPSLIKNYDLDPSVDSEIIKEGKRTFLDLIKDEPETSLLTKIPEIPNIPSVFKTEPKPEIKKSLDYESEGEIVGPETEINKPPLPSLTSGISGAYEGGIGKGGALPPPPEIAGPQIEINKPPPPSPSSGEVGIRQSHEIYQGGIKLPPTPTEIEINKPPPPFYGGFDALSSLRNKIPTNAASQELDEIEKEIKAEMNQYLFGSLPPNKGPTIAASQELDKEANLTQHLFNSLPSVSPESLTHHLFGSISSITPEREKYSRPLTKEEQKDINTRKRIELEKEYPFDYKYGVSKQLHAFVSGILSTGSPEEKARRQIFPITTVAGGITGFIAPLRLAKGMGIAPKVTGILSNAPLLGTVVKKVIGQMAQTGAAFGIKELNDKISEALSEGDIDIKEAISSVIDETAFGGIFGVIDVIPKPLQRIPSQALYGYVTTRLRGGSIKDASLSSILFAALGMLNRANLNDAYKFEGYKGTEQALIDAMMKEGVPEDVATSSVRKNFFRFVRKSGGYENATIKDFDELTRVIKEDTKVNKWRPPAPSEPLPEPLLLKGEKPISEPPPSIITPKPPSEPPPLITTPTRPYPEFIPPPITPTMPGLTQEGIPPLFVTPKPPGEELEGEELIVNEPSPQEKEMIRKLEEKGPGYTPEELEEKRKLSQDRINEEKKLGYGYMSGELEEKRKLSRDRIEELLRNIKNQEEIKTGIGGITTPPPTITPEPPIETLPSITTSEPPPLVTTGIGKREKNGDLEIKAKEEEVIIPKELKGLTEQEIDKRIEDRETDLVNKGINIFAEGFPMPKELSDLYNAREKIYEKDTHNFIDKIIEDSALEKTEATKGLKSIYFEKDRSAYFTQKNIKDWGISTNINIENLYNSFKGENDPYVNFLWGGTADNPVLIANPGFPLNKEAIIKTEKLYNAIAQNIGEGTINLSKHFREKIEKTEPVKELENKTERTPEKEVIIPKGLEPLAEEARKYKSAEEFVNNPRPSAIKEIVNSGGNPVYHDTSLDGLSDILNSGEIRPHKVASQKEPVVSVTRDFANYSRYKDSPYRLVLDEKEIGHKGVPYSLSKERGLNWESNEAETTFLKAIPEKAIKAIALNVSHPQVASDLILGKLDKIINLAASKGIKINFFDGKKIITEEEAQSIAKSQFTDIWNKAQGKEVIIPKELKGLTEQEIDKGTLEEFKIAKDMITPETPIGTSGEKIDTISLSEEFKKGIDAGVKWNKPEVLSVAKKHLGDIDLFDNKNIEEAIEYATIKKAREISLSDLPETEKFEAIKTLYENQPILGTRTSDSISKQQYSTPVPMAYLMNKYLDLSNQSLTVYEPTAGSGMLLIGGNKKNVLANEIDTGARSEHLKDSGFITMNKDARDVLKEMPEYEKQFDRVIMNPPFGTTEKVELYDKFPIKKLEHQIAIESLKAMKDEGKAAIIIGGHNFQYDKENETWKMSGPDRMFLNHLYSHYDVSHNIDVSGDVYRKMGTSYPIRLITIEGRKTIPDKQYAPHKPEMVESAKTFDEIKDILEKGGIKHGISERKTGELSDEVIGGVSQGGGVRRGERGIEPSGEMGAIRSERGQQPKEGSGTDIGRYGGERTEGDVGISTEERGGGRTELRPGGTVTGVQQPTGILKPKTKDIVKINELQAKIPSFSKAPRGNNLIPVNMADDIYRVLSELHNKYGDFDDFILNKLQLYKNKDELFKAFAGEQIEALVGIIHNIDNNEAYILGDQTGVGKGRTQSGVIRYANVLGLKPIFFTAKANLFTDIYRDLVDIGYPVNPFIINSEKMSAKITDAKGNTIFSPEASKDKFDKILENPSEALKDYDVILTTYSQFSQKNIQRDVLRLLAYNNIIIFDESHEAAGESQRGDFLIKTILNKAKSVIYASATYAKKPQSMKFYNRTALGKTGLSNEQLTGIIEKGGHQIQKYMAKKLVEAGQYMRRELDYTGININIYADTKNKTRDEKRLDATTNILRKIVSFDKAKKKFIKILDANAREEGEAVAGETLVVAGVDSADFSSVVHNHINQVLLSARSDLLIEKTIESINANKKPFIVVTNTMESFISDYAEMHGIKEGEPIDFTFKGVLEKALKGTLKYTKTDVYGNKTKGFINIDELPDSLKEHYDDVSESIAQYNEQLSASPIDYIKSELNKRGIKIGEITGRENIINFEGKTPTLAKRTIKEIKDRNKTVREYNNGDLDALIGNRSAAVGLSAHASETFKDKRPREMIIAQPDPNIDMFQQQLGRIFRKGQIAPPYYQIIRLDLPAEKRPSSVLAKKLKSLSATVSANKESMATEKDYPDMLNHYGDVVVYDYLTKHRDLNSLIGDPLKIEVENKGDLLPNAMLKVTGRVSILPTSIQETFYSDIEIAYNEHIEHLNQIGENSLDTKDLDIKAETIEKKMFREGTDSSSPFTDNSYIEKVSVELFKKPFNKAKIDELIADKTKAHSPQQHNDELIRTIIEETDIYVNKLKDKASKGDEETNKLLERTQKQTQENISRIESVLGKEGNAKIGKAYKIPIVKGYNTTGILIDIKKQINHINPSSLSNIKFVFAVTDPIQTFNVNLSNKEFFKNVELESQETINEWDKLVSRNVREDRYIITGNILGAYKSFEGSGELVHYSDNKGNWNDGILLSKYKQETAAEELAENLVVGYEKAYEHLNKDAYGTIDSDNNEVTINNYSGDHYSIIVPKTKSEGGKYYLNEDINKLTEKGFTSRFKEMSAIVNKDNIKEVMRILDEDMGIKYKIPQPIEDKKTIKESRSGEKKYEPPQGTPPTIKPPTQDIFASPTAPPQEINLPEETRFQKWLTTWQDNHLRAKVVMNYLKDKHNIEIPTEYNLYRLLDQMSQTQADKLRRLYIREKDFVKNLVDNKIDLEDLGKYVHARYAPIYNIKVNKIRKEMNLPPMEAPSSLTNKEAVRIMNEYKGRDDYQTIKDLGNEVINLKQELVHLLKDEGLITDKEYNAYIKDPLWVPLQRDIGDTDSVMGISISGGADVKTKMFKRPKGSEKEVLNPISNLFQAFQRAYYMMEASQLGRAMIEITKINPSLEDLFVIKKNPYVPVGKAIHRAEIDPVFFNKLTEFAKGLGVPIVTKGKAGKVLGYYKEEGGSGEIVRKFATSRETLAHEVAHLIAEKYSLKDKFYRTTVSIREAGNELYEFSKNKGEPAYRLKDPEERFANGFSWWLTHRDLAHDDLPVFSKTIEEIINKEPGLKPLLDILPSSKIEVEEMTETIFGRKHHLKPNEILTIKDGIFYSIEINDTLLANAMKYSGVKYVPALSEALKPLRYLINFQQMMATKYRLDFLLRNKMKDLGEALINIAVERQSLEPQQREGMRREFLGKIRSSQKEIRNHLSGKKFSAEFDEALRLGIDVGHFGGKGYIEAEKNLYEIEKLLKNEGISYKAKNLLHAIDSYIEILQQSVELGPRYAAYTTLVNRGMHKLDAIAAATDLTVKFMRHGELTHWIKPFYMFIGPQIQGIEKGIRTATNKSIRNKIIKILAGLTAFGVVQEMFRDYIDEDSNDQLTDFSKDTTVTIGLNGKQYTLWILPYFWSSFNALGVNMYQMANKKKTIKEGTKSIISNFLLSLSPVDMPIESFQHPADISSIFTPAQLKTWQEIKENRSWFGGLIRPEDKYEIVPGRKSDKYFMNASKASIFTARALYKLFGIDASPNDIEYALQKYFGGVYEAFYQFPAAMYDVATGQKEFEPSKIPVLRQIYREIPSERYVYNVLHNTLQTAGKEELSSIAIKRLEKALEIGIKKGIIFEDQASKYVDAILKAQITIGTDKAQLKRELRYGVGKEIKKVINQ